MREHKSHAEGNIKMYCPMQLVAESSKRQVHGQSRERIQEQIQSNESRQSRGREDRDSKRCQAEGQMLLATAEDCLSNASSITFA